MKIIFASKFYYRRGGLESYMFKAKDLLTGHGHEIIPFSTDFHLNDKSQFADYFCKYFNLSKSGFSGRSYMESLRATINMFYNREAYINMRRLIQKTNPDIVQGFGITKHLSYSVFKAAKDMGVTTVMRLSDFALLCPNSTASDFSGKICPEFSCSKYHLTKAVKNKCVQNSSLVSSVGMLEVYFNRFFGTYKKYIDYFIAPSEFLRDVFIRHYQISPERIIYIPIFDAGVMKPTDCCGDNYFLFAGRLSNEKGIMTLLNAHKHLENIKTVIAGTGTDADEYMDYAKKNNLNIEFAGHVNFETLSGLIKKCCAVIVPSNCYENSPNIVLEAYAYCKPVIGSRIGGIPELIDDNRTGLLFESGNVEQLVECMKTLHGDRDMARAMGESGHALLLTRFTPEKHYEQLEEFYDSIVRKKVLLINNFYYNRGGDCTYLFSLKKCLEEKGHRTIIFSMHHPKNFKSKWEKYFVNYINYDDEVKRIGLLSGIKVATRTIFFYKALRMLKKLIKEEKPEIAHLQNIHHHITPSILYALKRHLIPVVWTLHDYQLICPNISFLSKGQICERCKNNRYYWPPLVKCKKGSRAASLMSSIEIIVHNLIMIDKLVDVYIAPSLFLYNKFIEYGFKKDKMIHVHHLTEPSSTENIEESEDYYLFVGRISEEKGVKTLIDAAVKANLSKLKIVGSGPLYDELNLYAGTRDKQNILEFLGHKDREEVKALMNKCRFLVVPSEWYETSGLVVLEAFACGKAVIGSNIGGIPELIRSGKNGLIFEMGNSDELASKIKYMITNPDETKRMGANARAFVEKELTPDIHYQRINDIYNSLDKHSKWS